MSPNGFHCDCNFHIVGQCKLQWSTVKVKQHGKMFRAYSYSSMQEIAIRNQYHSGLELSHHENFLELSSHHQMTLMILGTFVTL